MLPLGVILPMLLVPACSVNHTLPSCPVAMPFGRPLAVGIRNSVILPEGVTLAMLLPTLAYSANHMLPSGPEVIPSGMELAVGMGNSEIRLSAYAGTIFSAPIDRIKTMISRQNMFRFLLVNSLDSIASTRISIVL